MMTNSPTLFLLPKVSPSPPSRQKTSLRPSSSTHHHLHLDRPVSNNGTHVLSVALRRNPKRVCGSSHPNDPARPRATPPNRITPPATSTNTSTTPPHPHPPHPHPLRLPTPRQDCPSPPNAMHSPTTSPCATPSSPPGNSSCTRPRCGRQARTCSSSRGGLSPV